MIIMGRFVTSSSFVATPADDDESNRGQSKSQLQIIMSQIGVNASLTADDGSYEVSTGD